MKSDNKKNIFFISLIIGKVKIIENFMLESRDKMKNSINGNEIKKLITEMEKKYREYIDLYKTIADVLQGKSDDKLYEVFLKMEVNIKKYYNFIKKRSSSSTIENIFQENVKQDVLPLLRKQLEDKYRLEQEMVRLCGGTTGLVQLREYMKTMTEQDNFKGIDVFRQVYKEKIVQLRKCVEQYTQLEQKFVETKKMIKRPTTEEKELCRLLEINNEKMDFYQEILNENIGLY